MSLTGRQNFLLHIGLGDVPASIEDVLVEIGDRLDDFQPSLDTCQVDGTLVLRLTVVAADLWLALLIAMTAVTGTGYPPHWIEAKPEP